MKMYLLSRGSHENKTDIHCYPTEEAARAEMVKELNTEGIKPYYYRYVGEPNDYFIDYGSHSDWFFIREVEII